MGQGGRHRHLARELAARGHTVSLIGARWTHYVANEHLVDAAPEIEPFEGFRFVRVSVPRYLHAHDKRRIINWFMFAWRLRSLPKLLGERPDVVLYSSPSLVGYLGAERLARRLGSRLIFEVRDIWPLSLIEIGGYSPKHPFIRFLQWIEDRAYARADRVVSNLSMAFEHMAARGMEAGKFAWVPNGFSLADVENPVPLTSEVLDQLPKGKFTVGYAGTIGAANSLITLIDAAEMLREREDIAFVLVGEGSMKSFLQGEVHSRGLQNVHFIGSVAKAQVQSLLSMFEVCFVGLRSENLFKFGVSPNKLFDYLYAGKPIIYSIASGAYRPVEEFEAGIQVLPENPEALSNAILKLQGMSRNELVRFGENGHKAVKQHHEYANLAAKLEPILLGDEPIPPERASSSNATVAKKP